MPIGNIWSGISFRHDDSIFVALAEPWAAYPVLWRWTSRLPPPLLSADSAAEAFSCPLSCCCLVQWGHQTQILVSCDSCSWSCNLSVAVSIASMRSLNTAAANGWVRVYLWPVPLRCCCYGAECIPGTWHLGPATPHWAGHISFTLSWYHTTSPAPTIIVILTYLLTYFYLLLL